MPPPLLDADLRIVMAGPTDVWRSAGLRLTVGHLLPEELATIVRRVAEEWGSGAESASTRRLTPWPGIRVWIYAVEAQDGRRVALAAERFRPRRDLRWAQRAFALSPRESEILRHVIRGSATPQIADDLSIAESTVVAHIKSLLAKTKASNRAAMVGRVLGFQDTEF